MSLSDLSPRGILEAELMGALARLGWPRVDAAAIMAPSLARLGTLGPGRQSWEVACVYLDTPQLRHLRDLALNNPGLLR